MTAFQKYTLIVLLFHTSIKGLFSLRNHRLGFRLPGGDRGVRFLLLLEDFNENTLVCQSFALLFVEVALGELRAGKRLNSLPGWETPSLLRKEGKGVGGQ